MIMTIFNYVVAVALCIAGIMGIREEVKEKKLRAEREAKDKICSVNITRKRMCIRERMFCTEIITVYTFLVTRESGELESVECIEGSAEFEKMMSYAGTYHGK